MEFNKIYQELADVPFMTERQAKLMYRFILEFKPKAILELGFAHGKSTCIMAAALEEIGEGKIITIDDHSAKDLTPRIESLIEQFGFKNFISPIHSHTTYNWELMKLVHQNNETNAKVNNFDFCYIDGAHNFETDSAAFFLVDLLLNRGGAILFDDMDWTYASSEGLKGSKFIEKFSEEELTTPHIKTLFDNIVVNHPNYHNFSVKDEWGWAFKKDVNYSKDSVKLKSIYDDTSISSDIKNLLRKIKNRIL